MHTLIGLLVATAAACAIARPPGPTAVPGLSQLPHGFPLQPPHRYLGEYLMPRLLMPNYFSYEDSIRAEPLQDDHEWLNKEIDRLNQMEEAEESLTPFDVELSRWIPQVPYMPRPYEGPMVPREPPSYMQDSPDVDEVPPLPSSREIALPKAMNVKTPNAVDSPRFPSDNKRTFAMTPLDEGYYEPDEKLISQKSMQSDVLHEGGHSDIIEITPPRLTRQNPNLGRTKNLVAENLDRLRTGFTHEAIDATDKPQHFHVLEATNNTAENVYAIILIAIFGAAVSMSICGLTIGWYKISKKAKAAADFDYPAYGVTGPTIDSSGDRKLAHSAHMYHYQHQKQQIIAMERNGNGLEQRNGSVSDPESEEENEEGDYTVYECPGFATTGEMEVKNPLFSEEPTPATPGKCELVKPQPKD